MYHFMSGRSLVMLEKTSALLGVSRVKNVLDVNQTGFLGCYKDLVDFFLNSMTWQKNKDGESDFKLDLQVLKLTMTTWWSCIQTNFFFKMKNLIIDNWQLTIEKWVLKCHRFKKNTFYVKFPTDLYYYILMITYLCDVEYFNLQTRTISYKFE